MPQIIVVVEVLIAERAKYLLPDKRCDLVLDQLRTPFVVKAGCKTIDQSDRTIAAFYLCKTE